MPRDDKPFYMSADLDVAAYKEEQRRKERQAREVARGLPVHEKTTFASQMQALAVPGNRDLVTEQQLDGRQSALSVSTARKWCARHACVSFGG